MNKYQVIDYTSVGTNSEGQYYVQDKVETDLTFNMPEDGTDKSNSKDICSFLYTNGLLSTDDLRRLDVSDVNSDVIEIKEKKTGFPLCRLERDLHKE